MLADQLVSVTSDTPAAARYTKVNPFRSTLLPLTLCNSMNSSAAVVPAIWNWLITTVVESAPTDWIVPITPEHASVTTINAVTQRHQNISELYRDFVDIMAGSQRFPRNCLSRLTALPSTAPPHFKRPTTASARHGTERYPRTTQFVLICAMLAAKNRLRQTTAANVSHTTKKFRRTESVHGLR